MVSIVSNQFPLRDLFSFENREVRKGKFWRVRELRKNGGQYPLKVFALGEGLTVRWIIDNYSTIFNNIFWLLSSYLIVHLYTVSFFYNNRKLLGNDIKFCFRLYNILDIHCGSCTCKFHLIRLGSPTGSVFVMELE